MVPHMVCVLPFLTTANQVRRLRISVPLVDCLVDGQKYFRPGDLPPAAGEELRPLFWPRLTLATDRQSPHRDAALAKHGGNPRRATVELAVEGRLRPAAAGEHLAKQCLGPQPWPRWLGNAARPRRSAVASRVPPPYLVAPPATRSPSRGAGRPAGAVRSRRRLAQSSPHELAVQHASVIGAGWPRLPAGATGRHRMMAETTSVEIIKLKAAQR